MGKCRWAHNLTEATRLSNWFLLLDLIPLLVFVVLDSMGRLRWAIVGALLAAVLEVGYSLVVFGEIDAFAYVSLALIALFGGLSIKFDNALYFKFKPVIVNLSMAGVLIVTYALDYPLLLMSTERYGDALPAMLQQRLAHPVVQAVLERASLNLGFGFILQAGLVGWAAMRMSTWWWFATRSAGFYLMVFAVVLASM
jgi:intracellular septation protein A